MLIEAARDLVERTIVERAKTADCRVNGAFCRNFERLGLVRVSVENALVARPLMIGLNARIDPLYEVEIEGDVPSIVRRLDADSERLCHSLYQEKLSGDVKDDLDKRQPGAMRRYGELAKRRQRRTLRRSELAQRARADAERSVVSSLLGGRGLGLTWFDRSHRLLRNSSRSGKSR